MDKINDFYVNLSEKAYQKIEQTADSAIQSNESDMGLLYDTDYLSILAELTREMDCTFKVVTVEQMSYSNHYQCMIHVLPQDISYSELPVLTSWGSGEQLEDAKQNAAGNAIKLMSLLKQKRSEKFEIESVSDQ